MDYCMYSTNLVPWVLYLTPILLKLTKISPETTSKHAVPGDCPIILAYLYVYGHRKAGQNHCGVLLLIILAYHAVGPWFELPSRSACIFSSPSLLPLGDIFFHTFPTDPHSG